MEAYENTSLWQHAFAQKQDGLDQSRSRLIEAYRQFRVRVSSLLEQIKQELPALTLHDITHVDALWRIASEISGPDYDLNPAEAFVLGGAFLLHDAAHCRAAFPGGLPEIQATTEWQDTVVQYGYTAESLMAGSKEFQSVLFDTLRALHPIQARKLPFACWKDKTDSTTLNLLPDDELRMAYGDLIGEVAESHWWHPHELEKFAHRIITPPTCLTPASWTVNPLKIAVLLRVADAAHIDAQRAPRFLMLLKQPTGISKTHWQFQSKLHQPYCDKERNDLLFSGSAFIQDELAAWWLAYDAVCLANNELSAADKLLQENRLPRLAARFATAAYSPDTFARQVPTQSWHPVDTSVKITDITSVVQRFGGEKLYGNDPTKALRELLQNAIDAVHACRSLGWLRPEEGEIEITLEDTPEGHWLHVSDTGIGMSRYVLTEVLLDFGRSLWRSTALRGEWDGLASSGFEAIGQFGIGFFSVFMLGEQVRVLTRRHEPKGDEPQQWLLDFSHDIRQRPVLREPTTHEKLPRHGTRVSVLISSEKLQAICRKPLALRQKDDSTISFAQACARLAPAADINLYVTTSCQSRQCIVQANDWRTLSPLSLIQRIAPGHYDRTAQGTFGPWSHLTTIINQHGHIVGRCAVQLSRYNTPKLGIGVNNGLFAGMVGNVAGIILTKQQNDFARNDALPDITLLTLQQWAEDQKQSLIKRHKLSAHNSALLAAFGASNNQLILGNFGSLSVSYEDFIKYAPTCGTIFQHDGCVDYDEDEDEVLRREFEDFFEPTPHLLQLEEAAPPDWVDMIPREDAGSSCWSLEAVFEEALLAAWKEVEWSEDSVVVGSVNGVEITRRCTVARRAQNKTTDTSV